MQHRKQTETETLQLKEENDDITKLYMEQMRHKLPVSLMSRIFIVPQVCQQNLDLYRLITSEENTVNLKFTSRSVFDFELA